MQDIQAWFSAFMEDWNIKLAAGSVIAFLADWLGDDMWIVTVLFCLIAADFVLGLTCALRFDGGFSSRRLHDGVIKIVAYMAAILLVWLVQEITLHSLPVRLPVLALFAAYQSLTEIKSVTLHLERLGLRMPALFHRVANGVEHKIGEEIGDALKTEDRAHDGDE